MEPDISTWRKSGHFYFALTRTCHRLPPARSAGLEGFLALGRVVGIQDICPVPLFNDISHLNDLDGAQNFVRVAGH